MKIGEGVYKYGLTPPPSGSWPNLGEEINKVASLKKILDAYLDFLAEIEKAALSGEISRAEADEFAADLKLNLGLLRAKFNDIKRNKGRRSPENIIMYGVFAP